MVGLTPEQLVERRGYIGGSDARAIMEGRWHHLWLEKTGRVEAEDLSGNLAVQLGLHTEQLNLDWFERQTGHQVMARGEIRVHPYFGFARVTLDGMTEHPATVQAKWCNPWSAIEQIEQWHMAQVHHEMIVCGCELAFLSVITGKPSYELIEIRMDSEYSKELLERERAFWNYVDTDTPPPDTEPVAAPVKILAWRSVDLSKSNAWTTAAVDWLEHKESARKFDKAAKSLRELVDPDVNRAHGKGVEIVRNKAGSLSIREMKNG